MLPVAQDAALAMQGRAREQLAKLMAKPFQPRPLTKPMWVAMPVRPPSIPAVARELAQALALAKAVGSRAQKQPGAARAESVSALTSGLKPQRMAQQAAAQYVRLAPAAAVVTRPVAQQPEAPQRSVPAQPESAHSAAVRDAVQVPQPAARRQ